MFNTSTVVKLLGTAVLAGVAVYFVFAMNTQVTAPIASEPVTTTPSSIAITLDDLPYVTLSNASPEDGMRYVKSINEALAAHNIVATGFVVGQKINEVSEPALDSFVVAGHLLANHSWSHPDYDTLSLDEFRQETFDTDQTISGWLKEPKYYRFPYLREGKSEARKLAATQILTELGFQNAPVTIDNDEWRYNAEYSEALENADTRLATRIADHYLAHMKERSAFFQNLSKDTLGRDVKHVLLLHMNQINADHLGTLLDWYVAQGWSFITLEDAMRDPVFSAPDLYAGPRGLSQIERVLGYKSE